MARLNRWQDRLNWIAGFARSGCAAIRDLCCTNFLLGKRCEQPEGYKGYKYTPFCPLMKPSSRNYIDTLVYLVIGTLNPSRFALRLQLRNRLKCRPPPRCRVPQYASCIWSLSQCFASLRQTSTGPISHPSVPLFQPSVGYNQYNHYNAANCKTAATPEMASRALEMRYTPRSNGQLVIKYFANVVRPLRPPRSVSPNLPAGNGGC